MSVSWSGGLVGCVPGETCVLDGGWFAEADSDNGDGLAGEATLVLPLPDPSTWHLTSGYLRSSGGGLNYWGWYDATYPPFLPDPVGFDAYVVGADGTELLHRIGGLGSVCVYDGTLPLPVGPPVICGDGNPLGGGGEYVAAPGDPAFAGSLTIRYAYSKPNLETQPFSESYEMSFGGEIHLVYSPVPEPNTGLLVMTGLLGLAYRQRRHGWAA